MLASKYSYGRFFPLSLSFQLKDKKKRWIEEKKKKRNEQRSGILIGNLILSKNVICHHNLHAGYNRTLCLCIPMIYDKICECTKSFQNLYSPSVCLLYKSVET